jgi:hypothetical protein
LHSTPFRGSGACQALPSTSCGVCFEVGASNSENMLWSHIVDAMMARDLKVVAVAGTCFPCMPHMPRAQRSSRELAGSVHTACNGGRYIYRRVVVLWRAVSVGIGWRWVGMGSVGYIIYAIHPIRAAQPVTDMYYHTSHAGTANQWGPPSGESNMPPSLGSCLGRRLAQAFGRFLDRKVRILTCGLRAATVRRASRNPRPHIPLRLRNSGPSMGERIFKICRSAKFGITY